MPYITTKSLNLPNKYLMKFPYFLGSLNKIKKILNS